MVKTINIFITVAIERGTFEGIWLELFSQMCRCSVNGEERGENSLESQRGWKYRLGKGDQEKLMSYLRG